MNSMQLTPATDLVDQFEVLKCLVSNLCQRTGRKPFVVAFTSCEPGEGVTSVAVNFTGALIRDHSPHVLLVDGNMAKPALHRFFSKAAEEEEEKAHEKNGHAKNGKQHANSHHQGIRDWQILQANPNLDVILAHEVPTNDQRLMKITEFCDFLNWVKREYEYVVIDCPAMNRSSSAAVIASKADAVVLVVEAERIRREVILRSINTLEDLGANILGVVLNKRQYPIPDFLYRML
jgi:capsular exopolysaccharide synthesis family protein